MPNPKTPYRVTLAQVLRLWFDRQGLSHPREKKLSKRAFISHLEKAGGLQLDTVYAVDRAHYLTLWSRFGVFDRALVDRWVYQDRLAFEYWGHEASILPASRLPLCRRGMLLFKPRGEWWAGRSPSRASIRRVLKRLREDGPLESADFEKDAGGSGPWWGWKEDKASLEILWHGGRVAIEGRRHFRRLYNLAERVYPECRPASQTEYEDGWLHTGLSGNGVVSEKHILNYWTAPRLGASARKKVLAGNVKRKRVVEVEIEGRKGSFFARPEDLDGISRRPKPRSTTLICPFDSLLWQRDRAEDLLDFRYRIEIYTPKVKRKYGYYVMPILHEGELVGRLDPKLHRDRNELEIKAIFIEKGFQRNRPFDLGLARSLRSLGEFLGATRISLPKGWGKLI